MSATEVAANNRAFELAVETGNREAIAALLAEDVMILPPASPVVAGTTKLPSAASKPSNARPTFSYPSHRPGRPGNAAMNELAQRRAAVELLQQATDLLRQEHSLDALEAARRAARTAAVMVGDLLDAVRREGMLWRIP
jgi:hypothetical protein